MTFNVAQKGNRDHEHMLGAGRAWFMGKFPADWERLRSASLESGIEEMLRLMRESGRE